MKIHPVGAEFYGDGRTAELIVCFHNFANDPNEFALNTRIECTTRLFNNIVVWFVECKLLIISRVRFIVNRVGVSFLIIVLNI